MRQYYNISDRAYEKKNHARMAKQHDFEEGVMCLTRRFSKGTKLSKQPYWLGPLTVIEKIGRDQVLLEYLVTGQRVKRHYSHLKHFWLPINPDDPDRKFYCAQVRKLYQMHQNYPINSVDLNLPEHNDLEDMVEPLEFYLETDIVPDLTRTMQAMNRPEQDFNTDKDIEKLEKAQEPLGLGDNLYGTQGSVRITPPPKPKVALQDEEPGADDEDESDKQVTFQEDEYVNNDVHNDNIVNNDNIEIDTSKTVDANDAVTDVVGRENEVLPKVPNSTNNVPQRRLRDREPIDYKQLHKMGKK